MKYSELHRKPLKMGWAVVRQSGSHLIMQHEKSNKQLVMPNHGSKEIGKGLQKKILKDAKID